MDATKNEDMRKEFHDVRVKLDECLQKILSRVDDYSHEISEDDTVSLLAGVNVISNLQSTRMWLGKMIGGLKDELPDGYPKDLSK